MSSRICLAVKLAALGWTVRPLTDAREMGCPRRKTAGSTAGVMSSPEVGQYERTSLDRLPVGIEHILRCEGSWRGQRNSVKYSGPTKEGRYASGFEVVCLHQPVGEVPIGMDSRRE